VCIRWIQSVLSTISVGSLKEYVFVNSALKIQCCFFGDFAHWVINGFRNCRFYL